MQTKLIVGLGNPDLKYQDSRHNVGFAFIDYTSKKLRASNFESNKKIDSLITKTRIGRASVILAKPQTYVNKTGQAALKLKNFYKIKPENLILVHDDLDIDFGNLKMSFNKNSGGHKGVDSVIRTLKTKKIWRLRVGIATPALRKARQRSDKKRDEFVMKFVLSRFTPKEEEMLKKIFKEAYEKISCLT